MSGPRNPKAYAEGRAVHAAVIAILAARPPLAAPLTAKAINTRLPPHLRRSESAIREHVREIRREAEEIDRRGVNLSGIASAR
jgi:hypothetical protein